MDFSFKYNGFISYLQKPDKQLAIAIREGLMRLGAKRHLLKFRALEIFRDEANASGVGTLAERIQEGICNSEYLILLARPEIIKPSLPEFKNWVFEEIEFWLKTKHPNEWLDNKVINDLKIIICIVDGEIQWHENDFNWTTTTCLNGILKDKFSGMPKWVDFRGIIKKLDNKNENDSKEILSLGHPDFLQKVAEISAEIQHKTVDELIAEDRRRQRLWSSLLGGVSMALIILAIVAILLGLRAQKSQVKAEENFRAAENQRKKAEENLKSFKIEKFQRDMRNGKVYLEAEEYCYAEESYQDAYVTANDTTYKNDPVIEAKRQELKMGLDLCIKYCRNEIR